MTRTARVTDIRAIQRLYQELDKHHADLLPDVFRSLTEDARPDSLVRDWIEDTDADYMIAEDHGRIDGFLNIRFAPSRTARLALDSIGEKCAI